MVNFASLATFSWLSPIIARVRKPPPRPQKTVWLCPGPCLIGVFFQTHQKGYQKPLEQGDLGHLNEPNQTEVLAKEFAHTWKQEVARAELANRTPSLFWTLLWLQRYYLSLSGVLLLVKYLSDMYVAFLIGGFLDYMEMEGSHPWTGAYWTFMMLFVSVLNGFAQHGQSALADIAALRVITTLFSINGLSPY